MRILTIMAAVALTVGGAGTAIAQDHPDHHNNGMRHDDRGRGYGRGHYDHGRHHGWNRHRRCRTVWVHHHRVRQCR